MENLHKVLLIHKTLLYCIKTTQHIMYRRYVYYLICVIFLLVITYLLYHRSIQKLPAVYCLMITGKNNDVSRNRFAKVSVQNFQRQTYPNKFLIVINEGNRKVLDTDTPKLLELQIKNTNLGAMRNIALELVPPNAIWTTWDDDDWRSDTYLEVLFRKLSYDPTKRYLMYCNRIDHNINTDFSHRVTIPSGTYIFFAYKDPLIKYDEQSTKEDAVVKRYILSKKSQTVLYRDNDYTLYVRFVHQNNTSLFVEKNKKSLTRHTGYVIEDQLSSAELKHVNLVKKNYMLM